MSRIFRNLTVVLGIIGLMVLGCGQTGPVSSQDEVQNRAEKPISATTISATTMTTAMTTSTVLNSKSTSDYYYPNWGFYPYLNFNYRNTTTDVVVKDAWFNADPRSLVGATEPVLIDMTVYSGSRLSDVNVVFNPSGLSFDPAATLTIRLMGPVTAQEVQTAWHFCNDGRYIELITTEVTKQGNILTVQIRVPGFSRYSLGGDR